MLGKLRIKEGSDNVVLLLCGAFSPPTVMHLRLLEMAREYVQGKLGVHVALGVLSPVHDSYRKQGLVSGHHRLQMLHLSTQSSDWIEPWDWECEQSSWTRTRVVMEELFKITKCRVMLCAGADLLMSFSVPNLWSDDDVDFICRHGVLILDRAGVDIQDILWSSPLLFSHRWNVHTIPQPISNEISSTKIRLLISRGLSIRYLVDDAVCKYIESSNIYK